MFTETRGGFEPSDVTEEAVKPIGSPASVLEVTIAIPLAWFLKIAFSADSPDRSKVSEELVITQIRLGHQSLLRGNDAQTGVGG